MASHSDRLNQINRYRRLLSAAFLDVLIVLGAYLSLFALIPNRIFDNHTHNTAFLLATAAAMVAVMAAFKVYHRIWERTSGHSVSILLDAVVIVSVVTITVVVIINPRPLSIGIVLVGNLLSLIGFVAVRYRSRLISGFAWRWHVWWGSKVPAPQMNTLIVGAGESGQALALRMKHHSGDRFQKLVGFVDDDPNKKGMFVEGSPVLGSRTDIPHLVKAHNIELIAVAIHNISSTGFRDILHFCEMTDARIKIVPDVLMQMSSTQQAALLRDVRAEDLLGRGVVTRHESVDLTPVINKSILITGAAGSIGSELSRQILTYQPKQLLLLDNNESGLHDLIVEIQLMRPDLDVVAILADITVCETLRRTFETYRPEIVFHAAAYKHVPMLEYHPIEAIRVNVAGTKLVAELASEFHAERFVLISTDKAVDPSSVMGASKRVCELILHALCVDDNCSTRFTSVRFGNVLGSRGSVVPTFTHQIEMGGPVTVTHPEMTRYFMSIPEAVNLIIHAASMTQGDDIYILQMGEVVRIVTLAERLIRLRGLRPHHDIEIKYTGVRPGEKMHEALVSEAETPNPTEHPNIIQVNTWPDDFSLTDFWHNLRELTNNASSLGHNVLSHLRSLIKVEPIAAEQEE